MPEVTHEAWRARQESVAVEVDGHRVDVAVVDEGPDAADEQVGDVPEGAPGAAEAGPVVFLHGIPTWSFLWRDVVDAVPDTARTIVPDLAGYGFSDRHDGFDRSIRAQEGMLGSLLDALDVARPVTLVAHDIGGGVALRYAAHNPADVDRLVLSNAVCYDSWPVEFIANLGLPATADLDRDDLEEKLEFAFADGLYGDAADHEAFVAGMKAPWLEDDGARALSRAAVATNTNHTTEIDYGAIDAETLLLWGADDVLQPISYAERLAGDVGGQIELVRLHEAYHWVVEDRTEAYCEELAAFIAGGA